MAKVLFITQKVDEDDSVLGVYHHWIEKLSEKIDEIKVICLYRGRVDLPSNVSVYSLGKDKLSSADLRGWRPLDFARGRRGFTRIKYIVRFWKYVWQLRHDYDAVFVHMNPIYVVLGGLFWKLSGKNVLLWYNHPLGNLTARIGIKLADKVFCTSPYSFAARYNKTILMPAGIDTLLFKPSDNVEKKHNRILFLGRISPIKKVELLIEAAKLLDDRGVDFELLIVGSVVSAKDKKYELELRELASDLAFGGKVIFWPSVPNYKTPGIYNSSGIFVNLTPTGSFDKAILEAMACGVPALAANKTVERYLPKELRQLCLFQNGSASDLCNRLERLLKLSHNEEQQMGQTLRAMVVKHHSLDGLMKRLSHFFEGHL